VTFVAKLQINKIRTLWEVNNVSSPYIFDILLGNLSIVWFAGFIRNLISIIYCRIYLRPLKAVSLVLM